MLTCREDNKINYHLINIIQCLSAQAGLKAGLSANEVEEILTLSKSQPIKDKLKNVTEEALEYKVQCILLASLYHLSFPPKCLCGQIS